MQFVRSSAAALLCVFLPSVLAAQDQAGAGFALNRLPYPGQSATATFGNGDVLTFDGASIDRYAADGTHLVNYATFLVPVFVSFLQIDAGESYALIGESTNHSVARLDFSSGTVTPLATLVFNYDAAQGLGDDWYVSAATCGFSCGNDIWRVGALNATSELEAVVSGASGPVATDASGNLYYATVSGAFPAPPGSTSVVFFPAVSLAGAPVLGDGDAFTVGGGFDGASDLAFDRVTGRAYLAENNFGTGTARVYGVSSTAASSPVVVEGQMFGWITGLELQQGADAAVFAAYQPSTGGRLLYNNTDFFSSWTRNELVPLRPQLSLTGPGASGAGLLSLDVSGGVPGGVALFAAAPTSSLLPSEAPIPLLSAVPLLSPLALAQVVVLPVVNGLDGNGEASRVVPHDGSLLGVLTVQALLLAPDLSPSATTNAANL